MLVPTSSGVAFALLTLTMFFWGWWPSLREFCGLPMPSFALLNMVSQFVTSVVLAATIGSSALGDGESGLQHLQELMSQDNTRSLVIVAGGFVLGHGDHLGSLAMQFIPASVAYPLYAGVSLVCGTCLNAAQVGFGPRPGLVLLGLALILSGLVCLAISQDIGSRHAAQSKAMVHHSDFSETESPERQQKLSPRRAMLLCLIAGLMSGGWSPLSTFARNNNPLTGAYVTAFMFTFGQLCAYPSVAWLGTRIGDANMAQSFGALTLRHAFFGCLCGVAVNSGYVMYFLASVQISPTIAFCMASCNPLLALAIGVLRCQFRDANTKQLILLSCSASLYALAIALLALAK